MNYIELINKFWVKNEEYSFQPTAIALYFYLLKVNNRCSWKESFRHNNKKIEVELSISYKSLCSARNTLKQFGLIDFKTQKGNSNVTYSLTSAIKDEVRAEVWAEGADEVRTRYGQSKDKLNKTKLNNISPISPKGKIDAKSPNKKTSDSSSDFPNFDFPKNAKVEKEKKVAAKKEKDRQYLQEVESDWQDVVSEWLAYKSSRGERYKSGKSVKAFSQRLKRLSGDNQDIAYKVINQSIANNWAGVFELKDVAEKERHPFTQNVSKIYEEF